VTQFSLHYLFLSILNSFLSETQIIEIQFKILSKGTSGWVSWFPTPPPELFEEGVQYIFYRFSVIAFLLSDR